jgi:hypothetical protein
MEDNKDSLNKIADDIASACEMCGEFSIGGIRFDAPSARLLDSSDANLSEHVAMQPAAIAFYGTKLKEATRVLAAITREKSLNEKKWHAKAKVLCMQSNAKPTISDIEAYIAINFELDQLKMNEKLDRAQATVDQLTVWYDAWKQKGYGLKGYVAVTEDERYTSGYGSDSISSSDVPSKGAISGLRRMKESGPR